MNGTISLQSKLKGAVSMANTIINGGASPYPKTVGPAAIASFSDGAQDAPLKSLVFNIEPVQSGSGDPSPTNIRPISGWTQVDVTRAGGNLFPYKDIESQTKNGVTITIEKSNGAITNIHMQGTATAAFSVSFSVNSDQWVLPKGECKLYIGGDKPTQIRTFDINVRKAGTTSDISASGGVTTFTLSEQTTFSSAYIWIYSGAVLNNNIIPVIVQSGVDTSVKYPITQRQSITISLGQTVYGGYVDVVRGKLVVDRAIVDLGNLAWVKSPNGSKFYATLPQYLKDRPNENYICTRYKFDGFVSSSPYYGENGTFRLFRAGGASAAVYEIYIHDDNYNDAATFKSAMSEVQLLYPATPIEVDLTPQTIKTLLGVNNIWADSGDTTLEYPIPTESPYPFESRPLYEITMAGTGTLTVNGKEWTITNYTGTLYCDTEAMEWYDASQLRNNIVSGDGWPVFEAGENSVSYTGDITKVMVTPRWRTL